MDLTNSLQMDADEAREHERQYRTIKAPTDEDKRIMAIFAALASGKQVIDLPQAIRDAGRDENGLPILAAGPVKAQWCYLNQSNNVSLFCTTNTGRRNADTIAVANFPGAKYVSQWDAWRSHVPMLPPEHRRWGRGNWIILWEVEEWAKAPRPPGDPILLKPLLGDLYTVEAQWDLTDVERLVLAQRP